MTDKKEGYDIIAYVLGLASIVFAFFTPLAGVVLAIMGLVQSKKEKSEMAKRAKKLSIVGLVLGIVFLLVSIGVSIYLALSGGTFPI